MKAKLLVFLLVIFSLISLIGCKPQGDPLDQARQALEIHKELLESAKSESIASQIVQFDFRLQKATPFLERDEKDLSKDLINAQENLQKAHDAWQQAIKKTEKFPKTPDSERASLKAEIDADIQTASRHVQAAESIINKLSK